MRCPVNRKTEALYQSNERQPIFSLMKS
jgi:hypothetical protein